MAGFGCPPRLAIGLAGAVAAAYGLNGLADMANLVNAAVVNGHSLAWRTSQTASAWRTWSGLVMTPGRCQLCGS